MSNAMQSFENWKARVPAKVYLTVGAVVLIGVGTFAGKAVPRQSSDDQSQQPATCASLPGFSALKNALAAATAAETTGLNNQMWATLVNHDGVLCAAACSRVNRLARW